MDDSQKQAAEAAAFRGLIAHLQRRTDVQNIDLMNTAGFCRNCLAKWLVAGTAQQGAELSYEAAREIVYGMPYDAWRDQFQTDSTPEQRQRMEDTKPLHAKIPGFGA